MKLIDNNSQVKDLVDKIFMLLPDFNNNSVRHSNNQINVF